jgi:hypothetical protein
MCQLIQSETFWVAITAGVALASLFTTIYLVRQQLKFSERDLHIRTQLLLDEKFNSIRIIKARKSVANELLNHEENPWETVMEFFESMGLLLRKESLDEEMVWATFSFYITGWWEASKAFIEKKSSTDDTMYSDFKFLIERMSAMDMQKQNKNLEEVTWTEQDVIIFLKDERDLQISETGNS